MNLVRSCSIAVTAALAFALGGCSVMAKKATLSSDEQAWRLPLHRPLTSKNPWLWGQFLSEHEAREWPIMVDSGAFHSALPYTFVDALKLRRRRGTDMVDARGRRKKVKGVFVPSVVFGDFEMRRVPFLDDVSLPLLGSEVLSRRPWRVDREEGVLIFGAKPWPESEVEGEARIGTGLGHQYYVDVEVGEHEFPLAFDTGASTCTLRKEDSLEAAMRAVPLERERELITIFGKTIVREKFVAEKAKMGSMIFSEFETLPLENSRPMANVEFIETKGLLGWQVLGRYSIWVDLGDRVQFKKRSPLVETAPNRIGRWNWVPACESAGCIEFVSHPGDSARPNAIEFTVSSAYPRDYAALATCLDEDGRIISGPVTMEVIVPAGFVGTHSFSPESPSQLERYWAGLAASCPQVALLDINPVRYAFENRAHIPYLVHAPLTGFSL